MPRPYSFALSFSAPKKDALPDLPRAQICLGHWTKDEKEDVFLSSDCVSLRELEYEITRLKRELDMIHAQGKKKFAAFDKRKHAWLEKHRRVGTPN